MTKTLSSKHRASDTNIFSVMSALAQSCQAVNLSQGFPDYGLDPLLGNLLYEATQKGFNQYAPMAGLLSLRQAITLNFERRYGITVDAEREITITPGATYALYTAFSTILDKGDEVIVLEPAYDSYVPSIEMNGGIPVPVALSGQNYLPDWEAIRSSITARTKAIIINTPHNPTGTVWTKNDFYQLQQLVLDYDLFVVSDEVYEQLVYDGQTHISILHYPLLRARSLAVFSFGKVFHNTGWKIGYCIASEDITNAFRRIHQYLAFSVHTPSQVALAQYLAAEGRESPASLLQAKRDFFIQQMQATPFKVLTPAAGSYFQLVSFKGLSPLSDIQFAQWLTQNHKVATIPISVFYSDHYDDQILRFCFAKKEETLLSAVKHLKELKF